MRIRQIEASPSDTTEYVEEHEAVFATVHADDFMRSGTLFESAQGVKVLITPPETETYDPKDILLVPRALTASYVVDGQRDIESARDQVIANASGRTVIGVNTPGFDYEPQVPAASVRQIYDSARGHGRALVTSQVAAIKEAMDQEGVSFDDARVGILGYCMGATVAARMFKPLHDAFPGLSVTDVTLIESPNDQAKKLHGEQGLWARLGVDVNRERVDRYLAWNDMFRFVQPYDRADDDFRQFNPERKQVSKAAEKRAVPLNLALFAAAMRGFVSPLIASMQEVEFEGRVHMVRVSESSVTPRDVQITSSEQLRAAGIYTDLFEITGDDHYHPIFQSLAHTGLVIAQNENVLRD